MARASAVRKAGARRQPLPGSPASIERVDPFIQALDGCTVRGPGEWVVSVTGIHRAPDVVFVQLSSTANSAATVVLRMAPQATAAQALAALEAWQGLGIWERPHVVDVMRPATANTRLHSL